MRGRRRTATGAGSHRGDTNGRQFIAFPDFGWGTTDGASRDEALAEARDLLRELIATTIREGKDLPEPTRGGKWRTLVTPPRSR